MAYDPTKAAGLGMDQLDAQASMPLLNIIQQNSPQLNEKKDQFIDGSKAGDIFFAPTQEVLTQPIEFTPTAFRTLYVEWVPKADGGGLVGMHPMSIINDPAYEQGRKGKYDEWLGDNELKKTTYVLGLISLDGELTPAMIALAVTGQKVSRKIQNDIRKFRYDGDLKDVPTSVFSRAFQLTAEYEENAQEQGYYNFSFHDPRVLDFEADEALLEAATDSAKQANLALPSPQESARPALPDGGDTIDAESDDQPY